MNAQQKKSGFTIIEVVLVLAIAGLIFLMVFIALPALQRNQRDTQRRSDLGQFVSQLQSFATNNNNKLPATGQITTFATNYLKWNSGTSGQYNDPTSGSGYPIEVGKAAPAATAGSIRYGGPSTKCDGETIADDTNSRQAAVAMRLEGSGVACQQVQR